nr:hypothetical protein [Propionivibrio sp.]
MNERQQLFYLLIVGNELDFNSRTARQFVKALLVHRMVSAKATDRAKCATSSYAQLVGFFEQPLPKQNAVMTLLLAQVKSEK